MALFIRQQQQKYYYFIFINFISVILIGLSVVHLIEMFFKFIWIV